MIVADFRNSCGFSRILRSNAREPTADFVTIVVNAAARFKFIRDADWSFLAAYNMAVARARYTSLRYAIRDNQICLI